jgi:hypothetical protein
MRLPLLFYRRIESEDSLFRMADGFDAELTSSISETGSGVNFDSAGNEKAISLH